MAKKAKKKDQTFSEMCMTALKKAGGADFIHKALVDDPKKILPMIASLQPKNVKVEQEGVLRHVLVPMKKEMPKMQLPSAQEAIDVYKTTIPPMPKTINADKV